MMKRLEAILTIAVVVAVAVAPSATAKPAGGAVGGTSGATAIALTQLDYTTSCTPADSRSGPYRCFAQPFGTPDRFGMQISIGSGSTPTPISMQGDGLLSFAGMHSLAKPTAAVTYTLTATYNSSWHRSETLSGDHVGYITLDVFARHRSCDVCVAKGQVVVAGEEPGIGRQSDVPNGDLLLVVTLRNPAGSNVPAGDVDVVVRDRGRGAVSTETVWSGHEYLDATISFPKLVARP